jgi:hypothetical protein
MLVSPQQHELKTQCEFTEEEDILVPDEYTVHKLVELYFAYLYKIEIFNPSVFLVLAFLLNDGFLL